MSATDIMTAFFDRLNSFTYFSVSLPIIWPGLQSAPPQEGIWLETKFFPNEPVDRAWDNDACVEARGYFMVYVCFRQRPDAGQVEPSLVADAIIEHFPKGTELGPVRVRKQPWQSPAITPDASMSYIPVTVSYMGAM